MLKENEELEDLGYNGLKIIQSKDGYRFTSDAVFLANNVICKNGDKVLDIGTGSGIIAILIATKSKAEKVVGIEIQERLYDMASRSVKINSLEDKISIFNLDLKEYNKVFADGSFDVVVTNPPYSENLDNLEAVEKNICKYEITLTNDELIEKASKLLKFGGKFYLINKAERMVDIITAMRKNLIEPKEIIPLQPNKNKDVDTILVIGKKNGKKGLKFRKNVIVNNLDGKLTEEAKVFYGK